jgi:hypothetical protein
MDRPVILSTENNLRFLLSLLHIANPGQPASEQSQAIEALLAAGANR